MADKMGCGMRVLSHLPLRCLKTEPPTDSLISPISRCICLWTGQESWFYRWQQTHSLGSRSIVSSRQPSRITFDPVEAVRVMEDVAAGACSEQQLAEWFRQRIVDT